MVFTAPVFLFLFLPITIIGHFLIKNEYRNVFLLIMSSIFYYWGEQNLILLMYSVILVNYAEGRIIDYLDNQYIGANTELYRKISVIVCTIICVGTLWYYKYWNFSIDAFNHLMGVLGIEYAVTQVDKIILPLGISFYTFHVLSYTYDVYMKKMEAEKNILNLAAYVLMFPQLVAGPIVRYIDIKKQFLHRTVTILGFVNGIRKFSYGMAKKVLIANIIAQAVDKIFALPLDKVDFSLAWIGAIGYTLQIYFDFSGYSDMAIGLAAMFGFKYKENFNYPYISRSASEFWRRWHISLSTWLRDYVYINIGGNRCSVFRRNVNVLIVFLLSGLWHGANYTFVAWGLWYGIFIVIENIFLRKYLDKNKIISHIYAIFIIVFGWVLFRCDSIQQAMHYWYVMCMPGNFDFEWYRFEYLHNDILVAVSAGIFFSVDWRDVYRKFVIGLSFENKFIVTKVYSVVVSFILFILSVMSIVTSSYNPFIYFRF